MSETRFNVCDLNAIETRVGAWLAESKPLMDVFVPRTGPDGKWRKNGNDPYLDFAGRMNNIPYEDLYYDLKILPKKDTSKEAKVRTTAAKTHRQIAKPGVLGAIYRLGGGGWGDSPHGYIGHRIDCPGGKHCGCPKIYDKIKTGLWGYAENMGVEMSQEKAHEVVKMFRTAYPEIPKFWTHLENMSQEVLDESVSNIERHVGPQGLVTMNRINIAGRYPMFRMRLPSGRYLHYLDARIDEKVMNWKTDSGDDVYKPTLFYAGQNQKTKQWGLIDSHGGKLFENLVQGISRDILAVKLLEFEQNDLPVHGHVHDEGICLVPNDPFSHGVGKMEDIMQKPIDWAPGLLLGADGFEDEFYHK